MMALVRTNVQCCVCGNWKTFEGRHEFDEDWRCPEGTVSCVLPRKPVPRAVPEIVRRRLEKRKKEAADKKVCATKRPFYYPVMKELMEEQKREEEREKMQEENARKAREEKERLRKEKEEKLKKDKEEPQMALNSISIPGPSQKDTALNPSGLQKGPPVVAEPKDVVSASAASEGSLFCTTCGEEVVGKKEQVRKHLQMKHLGPNWCCKHCHNKFCSLRTVMDHCLHEHEDEMAFIWIRTPDKLNNELFSLGKQCFPNVPTWLLHKWQVSLQMNAWIQCSNPDCGKWRTIRNIFDLNALPEIWFCTMNDDPEFNSCERPEKPYPSRISGFLRNIPELPVQNQQITNQMGSNQIDNQMVQPRSNEQQQQLLLGHSPAVKQPSDNHAALSLPQKSEQRTEESLTPEKKKRRKVSELKNQKRKQPIEEQDETSSDRLLPCGICGREFMAYPPNGGTLRIWKLREHVTLHFDGAVWKCPLCEFDSKNKQNVYLHLTKSKKHGDKGIGEKPELAVAWEDYVRQFKEVAPKCFPEQANSMNVQ